MRRTAGLALSLLACACSETGRLERGEGSGKATFVLVAVDDLRVERLGLVDGQAPLAPTPELHRRGRAAARFPDYVTPSTSSSAALASLLTARHPLEHGLESVRELGRHRLARRVPTLAEAFREAGWETLALVTSRQHTGKLSGLDRGFVRYLDGGLDGGEGAMSLHERLAASGDELLVPLELPAPLFLFVSCAELRAGSPPSGRAERLLRERLEPHTADVPGLAPALAAEDVLAEVARVLARRRGSAAWEVWQEVLYDARLEALDRGLAELFELVEEVRDPELLSWVLVGTRGCYLLEPRPDAPSEGFSEGLVRTPLLVSLPGLEKGEHAGLRSARLVAPTIARSLELGGPLAPAPALEDGALEELTVLSPRTGERVLVDAGLALGAPVPHGGSLRLRGEGALVVRDPRGTLFEPPAGAHPGVRITRDRRRAEVALPPGGEGTLLTAGLAGALVLELVGEGGSAGVHAEGTGSLTELAVPYLPAKRSEAWDVPEAEPPPWSVDVRDAGGGWVRVVVGEQARGLDVTLYCALYPPDEDRGQALAVRLEAGGERLTPRSLPGAAALAGRTPFACEIQLAGRRPALAVELAGRFVPSGEMRYLGRRFDGGTPTLLLLPWLPERADWFSEPRLRGAPVPAPAGASGGDPAEPAAGSRDARGTIWLGRAPAPNEGPWDLTSEEVRFLQRLRSE